MSKQKQQKKSNQRELRLSSQPQRFEIRTTRDGSRQASGYFATFGTLSHDLGFREVLQKGCFRESLAQQPVSCYRDHNPQMLLGKTQSSTLWISEDDTGIAFRVKLPDTSYANDLVALMERGDSYECSFAFTVDPDGGEAWSQLPNGEILRTITKAALYEGSILTGPPAAYPNTSANLRSCPVDLRSKLTKRDDDNDDDSDDYRPECDKESDEYEEDADCEDEDRSQSGDCDCTCDQCQDDGNCLDCSNANCESEDCLANRCGVQEREMHFALITRRLHR